MISWLALLIVAPLQAYLLSTSQQRQLWAPVCTANTRAGVLDAWRALDNCLRIFNYRPRPGVTGARSCRRITGGSGYSLHAYFVDGMFTFWNGLKIGLGIAVDINWDRNPYGSRLVTDMPRDMVEAVLAIRTNNGKEVWGWGGNYSRNKDAMHFELGCSPADLATGINWSTVRNWAGGSAPPPPPPPGVESGRKFPGGPGFYYAKGNKTFDGNVQYIQTRLNLTNLQPKLVADGFFGPATEKAVRGFQGAVGIEVDGKVGPQTWNRLNSTS